MTQNQPSSTPNLNSTILAIGGERDHQSITLAYLTTQNLIRPDQLRPDLIWLNQAGESLKIKTVRELIVQSSYATYSQKTRIFVLLHADNSSSPAQNALLKIIEEPPTNTLIILTANHPKQLLPTIQSRCILIHTNQLENKKQTDQTNNLTQPDSEEITALAQQLLTPATFTHIKAIALAEQYKNRDEAMQLIIKLINYLHQQQQLQSTDRLTQVLKMLLAAYNDLGANFNVRLTLEHHLFELCQV